MIARSLSIVHPPYDADARRYAPIKLAAITALLIRWVSPLTIIEPEGSMGRSET